MSTFVVSNGDWFSLGDSGASASLQSTSRGIVAEYSFTDYNCDREDMEDTRRDGDVAIKDVTGREDELLMRYA